MLGLISSVSFSEKGQAWGKKGEHQKSIKEKFFKKIRIIYSHQDELKITDQQLEQIKELKIALKKDLIRKKADIDIIAIDVRSAMHEDVIDIDAVNELIDKKYEIKKAKMKKIVESCAGLKKILTKEQKGKMKDLFCDKAKKHGPKGLHKMGRN